jgi:GNAT superfamily N-acetyltransferase
MTVYLQGRTTVGSIRPLQAGEAALVDRVFVGLSPRSRYLRFLTGQPRLSARERRCLANVDDRDHFAWIALSDSDEPLAIAHAIRLADQSTCAEVAMAVIDAWQRRGVGVALLTRLITDIVEVGIERIYATVLVEQDGLLNVMASAGWQVASHDEFSVELFLDLPPSIDEIQVVCERQRQT